LLATALAAVSTAALAADFPLIIENTYTDALTGLSVSGGKVKDFKRIPANGKRTFTVTLPDGKCEATVGLNFANGHYHDAGKFDFCEFDTLSVWFN
jgi:hypothetical protein